MPRVVAGQRLAIGQASAIKQCRATGLLQLSIDEYLGYHHKADFIVQRSQTRFG